VRSKTTRRFRTMLTELPEAVQRQARDAYRLFKIDPYYPSLHFKPIGSRDPTIYSARIGLRYRAVGIRQHDYIIWEWIGAHADYDKLADR